MNSTGLVVARRVASAIFVGTVLALPALYIANEISGGGHGSNYGFCTFFAPAAVMLTLVDVGGTNAAGIAWSIGILVGLYGTYGGVVAGARWRGFGLWAVLAIMCLHYGALAWVVMSIAPPSEFHMFVRVLGSLSLPQVVVLVELFIGLHVLAFQYALSTPPYRPRFTRPVLGLFGAGLAVGIALFAWANLTSG